MAQIRPESKSAFPLINYKLLKIFFQKFLYQRIFVIEDIFKNKIKEL